MCSQQLPLLHLPLLNELFTDIKDLLSTMSFFYFQTLFTCKSHVSVALDPIRLGSSCETQIILIEMM